LATKLSSLDVVDVELVQFEREPNNAEILDNIFRLVHTIKGTCGFLGLPRLESLAHAAETLMGKFRDGAPVTPQAVSVILISIDRIKAILGELGAEGTEPEGADDDLISQLDALSAGELPEEAAPEAVAQDETPLDIPDQPLERELKPGEISLDELELAFRNAPGPDDESESELQDQPDMAAEPAGFDEPEAEPAPEPVSTTMADAAALPDEEESKSAGERKEAVKATQSIRVNVDTLENLMTMVSELVLTRNQLLEMVRRLDDSEFKVPLQRLSNVTAELQEGVMKTRMQPIGNAWQKLPRIIRDLANDLGKKIDLEMHGAETELDRQVLELIKDPLTHMVRNSADHGIESIEERAARGKSEAGKVILRAFHEGGHIIIEIADDGKGLPIDKIKEKVVERGLASSADLDKMSSSQIYKYIFAPGFSTAQQVTNVSGRGVGMDVVRTNIELIGGSIDVRSEEGRGSTFTIKIPLTLAIVSALIVQAAKQRFAVPQLNVIELVRANSDSEHRIEMIHQTPVLRLRNRLLPLVRLAAILGIERLEEDSDGEEGATIQAGSDEEGFIVVARVGNQEFGIVVDSVFDTEEIVVKPMSTMLRDITVFSGNTILGDGSVIMIVDPNGIAQQVNHEVAAARNAEAEESASDMTAHNDTMSLLVFSAGSDEPKAVPLSLVTRLEQIDSAAIEVSNGQEMVQYRGQLMPLLRISPPREDAGAGRQPLLVFSDGERTMGIAVDEIIDIVDDRLEIEVSADDPGKVGSAVVKGRATEILDVGYYITQVFDEWLETPRGSSTSGGRNLLLVDDSPFFRDMLIPVLKSAGYEVTAVGSAADAIAMKNAGRVFDVIVSDIEMPEISGFEFAEQVKADEAWAGTPIIALSCYADRDELDRGRSAGFFDLVGKFDREGLIRTVSGSLRELEDAA
jgi:two-component system chemotaxis sensor kinase CheA